MNINTSEVIIPQNKREFFNYGIKINGIKYVVIELLDAYELLFVHAKSHEEGTIYLIGGCYSLIIQYYNELVPMYHSVKIDKLKKGINHI